MKVQIEIPDTSKGLSVTYFYYADYYEGPLTMGARLYDSKQLDEIEVKEDDMK